ncbi:hypothetical protein [Bhargavaea cecembensis]|uniref:hypothetical protein n=1 Tax=Bhargavaea cecembensis TaxID=394098 RepID=UPI0011781E7F|nr:hypothetical protein [Bhargavaea cecembensis]
MEEKEYRPGHSKVRAALANQHGYALLIVLVVLMMVSLFAVSFYTTSASNRLQQEQTESSVLSVGAAVEGEDRKGMDVTTGKNTGTIG